MPRAAAEMSALEPRLLRSTDASPFRAGVLLPVVSVGAISAAKGDFNNDGRLDLAVIGGTYSTPFSGGLQILLNQGKDHFDAGPFQNLTSPQSPIATGDFNGDGNLDLALFDQGNVSVYLGNGDGSITPAGQFLANYFNEGLYTGDFNGDGRIDLAANGSRFISYDPKTGSITTEAELAVLLNNGNGQFSTLFTHLATADHLYMAVMNYNNDGKSDIAYAATGAIHMLVSKGDGTFNFPANIPTGTVSEITAVDVNRDGRSDLLFNTAGLIESRYVLSLPAGGFGPIVSLPPIDQYTAFGLLAGDFNGDGRTDIVGGGYFRGALFQQGNGSFLAASDNSSITASVVGDFNNDGSDDIANGGQIFYASPLLAATLSPAYLSLKHTLVITGNRRADVLDVSLTGGNYVVTLNHVTYTFPASSVRRMQIATGLGADSINISSSIFCNALISSGAGDDTVHSGGGNDTLQGDNGNDILDAGAGKDLLQGGKDNDTLTGGPGTDSLFGNRGTDLFSSGDALSELLDKTAEQGEF